MRTKGRYFLEEGFSWLENNFRAYKYRSIAKKRLKRIKGGYKLGSEYESRVTPYWSSFGIKPKKMWYKLYSSYSNRLDEKYVPDDIWFGKIIPYFNNTQFRRSYEDKCNLDVLFPNVKQPQTIIKNMAGEFYDNLGNVITKDTALEIIKSSTDFLIKPSIDSGEGRLISFFDDGNLEFQQFSEKIVNLDCNYIVQKNVVQHELLSKLNPSSLNTVRVISLFFKSEVYILSSILRIGGDNSRVDNVGSGGYGCKILNNGNLNAVAVNKKSEWKSKHHNGIKFEDVVVPAYSKILEIIKIEHKKLPHFRIIGWDFGVDLKENPVLIEYNTCPGQNQMTCGPTFGDMTDEILKDIFIEKKYKNAKN